MRLFFFFSIFFATFYFLQAGGSPGDHPGDHPGSQSSFFRFLPSLGTSELYAQSRSSTIFSRGRQSRTGRSSPNRQQAAPPTLQTGFVPRYALDSEILDALTFVASGGNPYGPNLGFLFKTADHQAMKVELTVLQGSPFSVYQGTYRSDNFAFNVPTADAAAAANTVNPRDTNPDFPENITFRSDLEVPLAAKVQVEYARLGLSYRLTWDPESVYDSSWFFGVRLGIISSLTFLFEGRTGNLNVNSLSVDTGDDTLNQAINDNSQDEAVEYANEYVDDPDSGFSNRTHNVRVDIDDVFYYGLEMGYRGRLTDTVVLHTYLRVDTVPANSVSAGVQSDNPFLVTYLQTDRDFDLTEENLNPDVSYYFIPSFGIGISYILK